VASVQMLSAYDMQVKPWRLSGFVGQAASCGPREIPGRIRPVL